MFTTPLSQLLVRLLKHLPWRSEASSSTDLAITATEGEADTVLGCGWFDSSHDLHAGLCVQEHAQPDAVAQHLPLADWLDMQLSAWRVTPAM